MPPPRLWSRGIKQFLMSLKNWWNMAYTFCHAPIQITSNNIIIATMTSHCQSDVTAEPHSAKGLCKTFDNFVVAMVIDLRCYRCRSMADRIKSLKVWWSMSAMLHQICNDFINCIFFNRNLSFFSNK